MKKSVILLITGLLLTLTNLATAAPGMPDFMPAIYGDGPTPNGHNAQSFDNLYVISNANDPNAVQLPVSEAAPGNPYYNGGRWSLQNVTWTAEGFLAYGGCAPILKSEDEIIYNEDMGYLEISPGFRYFQCPLLSVH